MSKTLCLLFWVWVQIAMASALPNGVSAHGKKDFSVDIDSINFHGGRAESGRKHRRTFSVEAKHEELPGSGVRFNVETVPPALAKHLKKDKVTRLEVRNKIKADASAFYAETEEYPITNAKSIKIEALSNVPNTTVFSGGAGFLASSVTAFAQHLPLAISPDHVWAVLSYAFAKHVDLHAEELRHIFVRHEGKKRLLVNADHMVLGATAPEVWEDTIFPDFSRQIKEHVGEKVHSIIASDFTTTTNTARASREITLMSAMKNYFSYGMSTLCGIPRITLLGSEQDWASIRSRAEELGELMTPDVAGKWMPYLLPVLDEFVKSYKGDVDHGFWQSMVKLRNDGMGSGSASFVSGWIQVLFPYLRSGEFNDGLRPWNEMYFRGPEPEDFPAVVSSAPVDWDYNGEQYNLHFHAGITGFTQDPVDGELSPLIGWYVTHDPPQNPDVRLQEVKKEIEALLKGHEEEAREEPLDETAPWYVRVSALHAEQMSLSGPARRIVVKREMDELKKAYEDGTIGEEEVRDRSFAIFEKMEEIEMEVRKEDEAPISTRAMIKDFFSRSKDDDCSGRAACLETE